MSCPKAFHEFKPMGGVRAMEDDIKYSFTVWYGNDLYLIGIGS